MKKKLLLVLSIFVVALGGQGLFSNGLADEEEADYPTEPIVFIQPVKAVIFDHKFHVEEAGLDCESCHDDLFEQAAGTAEENDDFKMQALYEGKYCGACHDGETAFASNTKCAVCHIGVMGYNRMHKVDGEAEEKVHH
ncbi:class III cytochrome C family protein [Dissulfuribacter thermophilus]|uniref:Class III cytochrome C family protein n=1 Tax=Dissulfuribacter thermophilus TaxID=1156395 RepID=A0A1B9F9D7_9BACT|nr:c(7)-type cytochrome triheme domain-containing protein [Dissulfuribacter thermophilus]OCC16536.1 class III cytochrome C family protein [Dissulfuribacter thermophilus]